ncbi:uncharacterized protein BJX67DRAFT_372762 [Aspergillus lucknowensis]|uniref:Altered inheritance of mitochondria protein 9, mitochondrial n=1 Tax=Aspergillus lucknowensis TaxID=176173 RepID=A0ABR4LRQ9_9EURO
MSSFMRTCRKLPRSQLVAQMSISCRGKPISREELFTYTNGHFLINEDYQLARRYQQFNLDALCNIAATAVPCRIADPAFLTTASEVGTLEYIRKYTNIPVPRVFSWSPNNSNPVGAEYIIMEKAVGVPLFERWGSMPEIEKLELTKHLTQLEAQLSAISFPAYGGLYLRADADRLRCQDHDSHVDKQHLYCVGPSPDRSFDIDTVADIPTKNNLIDHGLWSNLSDFGISIAKRKLSRIAQQSPDHQPIRGSAQEQANHLEITIILMRMLDSHPILAQFAQPTLWHTDLHMGNIFVAPNNNSQITALIDVQSLSILPLFLQARWPVFLQPPQEYTKGLVQPELPGDFNSLDKDEKATALHDWTQAKLAKAYDVSTFLEDRLAHNAMAVPSVFPELFICVGETSDVGIVPLRECLIEVFQNCKFAKYQEWNEVQQLAQRSLDTDAEGWVAPQLDFAEKQRQNKELLSMYVARMAGEKSAEEARRIWPFPE